MNIHVSENKTARRVWTEEQIAEAAKMWSAGISAQRIGEHFGAGKGSITAIASSNRELFPRRKDEHGRPIEGWRQHADWLTKAAAMWMDGMSAAHIAKMTGTKPATVYWRIGKRPDLFPANLRPPESARPNRKGEGRSYIGNNRWVRHVPRDHPSGEVHTMPRVSMIDDRKGE